MLTRYFHPLYDDDDGDGGDDEGNEVWSHHEGGLINARGFPFLSSVGMWPFVRSFCCRVADSSSTTGKQAKQCISCFFPFVLACLSSPAPGNDCAGRGNGLSFFLFSCDPSVFFHAY